MYTKVMRQRLTNWPTKYKWLTVISILLTIGVVAWLLVNRDSQLPHQPEAVKQVTKKPTSKPLAPKPPLVDLQPTVDAWLASQSADYGIYVYDPDNKKVIASHQADKQYFTASIYKLYVAYLSLENIENGTFQAEEPYLNGKTRMKCINDMIQSSDSPCAEKMLAEIGQMEVTERLKAFGFSGTKFPGFTTTAQDAGLILQRLQAKQDLNQEHTNFLLEAMKTQIYRKGMPAGMSGAVVADKVGFNETINYHDVGIVTLPASRQYIVTIFSQNNGSSKPIASLSAAIYAKLNAN